MVNFDLPNVPETYVHRIGRTARAGASGVAISFCDGEERAYLRDIERLIRRSVQVVTDHPHVSRVPAGVIVPAERAPQQQRQGHARAPGRHDRQGYGRRGRRA